MRIGTALLLAAGVLPAQDKPEYTFGTTVATNSWLQGQVYDLKPGTDRLPRLDRMKPTGTIYTNMLNAWPQRFDQGFLGIMDRFEWFAIDYHGKFWIEQAGEYRFSLLSDDGARLAIDNQEFVNNDGIHAASALRQCRAFPRCPHDQRLLLSGAPLRRGAPAAQGSGRMGHGQDRPSAEIRAHRPGALTHSGSGLPLVSGANGNAAKPTKNTRHIVTPA